MAATGEIDDPAFPVGAACRIDSRSPWRQIAEIPVGLDPEGIAVDTARRRAFVACSRSDFVSVVDLETHEVIREIRTGDEPIDIGLDEETGRVFTADAHSDQVTIIDAATLEVETAVPVGGYPSGLTHVPEYRRLYVGNSLGSTMSVIDLDTLETVATVAAEPGAGAIGVDPTRRLVVCVNFVAASANFYDADSF
jgi:YVTN family beta-propeller protein